MILVFKTNINSPKKANVVSQQLQQLPDIAWNFDLEDCDRILRVVTETDHTQKIIDLLGQVNLACAELE